MHIMAVSKKLRASSATKASTTKATQQVLRSASRKSKKRLFSGMSYREVQRSNANRRGLLDKTVQRTLKAEGYKNVGWDNVVALYQKINALMLQHDPAEETLEDLFLKAERVGNKYQTTEEIAAFNQKLAAEVNKAADKIERQFPEPEGGEFVDYSQMATPVGLATKTAHRRKRR